MTVERLLEYKNTPPPKTQPACSRQMSVCVLLYAGFGQRDSGLSQAVQDARAGVQNVRLGDQSDQFRVGFF